MSDDTIIDLYLARDERAISETAAQYGSILRSLAKQITGDLMTAQECENDTYLRTWQSIPPHEPRTYFFAYLARITRNLALNCVRFVHRKKRDALVVELSTELENCLPATDRTEAVIDEKILMETISGFLKQQPPQARLLFMRRYWYMDSIADLSEQFKLPQGTIKSTLHRVRQALKEYLKKEGYQL
ncbi:MAG: RNA polymerase sigma factor [Eubacteriales bacterium]|nr:RNA polymerase sigma factor [Eubacteriales bacterium]